MKKLLSLFLAVVLFNCNSDDPTPITPEVLKESVVVATRTQSQIQTFIQGRGLPIPASEIRSGVTVYKITYKTTFKGNEVTASGLVALPDTKDAVAMMSFQHGTIAADSEAPSNTGASSDLMTFYAAMATPGFIGVLPDLIGFGASKDILHPYYVEKPTADAVVDCLKAARELALINGLNFNERLFLAGYSQGGYTTMVAHKAIETDKPEHFNLIASFPSSGGYDIKGVQEFFFKQTEYDQPFYLAFVALTYKTYFGFTQPLTDLFQEPYASRIPTLFNGTNTSGDINAQLTTKISSLIQPDILQKINTDTKYNYLNTLFEDNSPTGFIPKAKIFMYHGDLDITVPYQNSVDVYNDFISRGASKDIVTFTPLPYGTHSTGVTPYLVKFINQILVLK